MSHDTEATSSKRKLRKYGSAIDTSCAFETNDSVYARAWWSSFMHPAGLSKFANVPVLHYLQAVLFLKKFKFNNSKL
jgi:hypothetical protein